jgi:hypothetical protein
VVLCLPYCATRLLARLAIKPTATHDLAVFRKHLLGKTVTFPISVAFTMFVAVLDRIKHRPYDCLNLSSEHFNTAAAVALKGL